MTTAAELLRSVRGRRLCFEVAQRGAGGAEARRAMLDEARQVEEERGEGSRAAVSYLLFTGPGDAREPIPIPPLAEALADAATQVVDARHLLPALADTVASAMYWQPPQAEDLVLADPSVSAALLPTAEAVLAAPEARWWSMPVDHDTQVRTVFEGATPSAPQGTAAERLVRWRDTVTDAERWFARERARHPYRQIGGMWWVTPALAGLGLTSRALTGAGSAALWLTEDELGWRAAELSPCAVDSAVRVLEVTGPGDWAALVAAYPLDVTASRQPDWFGAVGAHEGSWLIPDWSAVAAAYDAVHVSVLGWLTTSGMAVPVSPGATTTLAGWGPDATWWLADAVREQGERQAWVRDDTTWRPADHPR
ncbi:hypothetical protein [Cellulomonas chengniuliangii]|uniref:hypothetical protein n=1 Tax=Cellulomonas chengniuliangii TaxID=2968084 RepID=UPI001D0DC611|nr:hypothetical protein [Cellulomonas chengniuliangii]MCC2317788.1 hypothetical protein [Cellulomonas chengniuliangii]